MPLHIIEIAGVYHLSPQQKQAGKRSNFSYKIYLTTDQNGIIEDGSSQEKVNFYKQKLTESYHNHILGYKEVRVGYKKYTDKYLCFTTLVIAETVPIWCDKNPNKINDADANNSSALKNNQLSQVLALFDKKLDQIGFQGYLPNLLTASTLPGMELAMPASIPEAQLVTIVEAKPVNSDVQTQTSLYPRLGGP